MSTPIQSLIATGTRVWLDSVDPDEVDRNRAWGITGATSNPIIVADLVKDGRLDPQLARDLEDDILRRLKATASDAELARSRLPR